MNIKPLDNRVLIEPISQEEKTKSGIVIPDTVDEEKPKPEQGKVVAIGEKVKEIKKGDTVLFDKYGPSEIKIKNKEYLIAKESDILAIIK
jgi:chaperonin GroES